MPRHRALDLAEQFSFYASYHSNPVNVAIHLVCIPTIFFTSLILTHGIPGFSTPLASLALPFFGDKLVVDLTVPFLTALGYATYFILLEPVAGALYAPILLTLGHLSNVLYSTRHDEAMRLASYLCGASWILQFIGHGKFEHRAPALLDSLLQSLVLAVFFVWLEVLFFAGYRPQLYKRLMSLTGVKIAEFRKARAMKEREGAKKAQ
ncbi:hypothetical protein JCM10207_003053 [Rhodosporidiobolus poonsookiae]